MIAWAECFFLTSAKTAHALGADRAAVAQQLAGVGLDEALVGDVREHEALDAHERGAAGERHGERLAVRAGQHLDAERQRGPRARTLAATTVMAATISGPAAALR